MRKLRMFALPFALIVPLVLASGVWAAPPGSLWAGISTEGDGTQFLGAELLISDVTVLATEVTRDLAHFGFIYYGLPTVNDIYFGLYGDLGYRRGATAGFGGWEIGVLATKPLTDTVWLEGALGFRSVNAATKMTKVTTMLGLWAEIAEHVSVHALVYNAPFRQFAGEALNTRIAGQLTATFDITEDVYAFVGITTATDGVSDVDKWIGIGTHF